MILRKFVSHLSFQIFWLFYSQHMVLFIHLDFLGSIEQGMEVVEKENPRQAMHVFWALWEG